MDEVERALQDASTDELLRELLGRYNHAIFLGRKDTPDNVSKFYDATRGDYMICCGLGNLMSAMMTKRYFKEIEENRRKDRGNRRARIEERQKREEEEDKCQKESRQSIGDDKPTDLSQQGSSSVQLP